MEIKTPKFLFDNFNEYENIEYELEWILSYCNKRIFSDNFYKSVNFSGQLIEYDVSVTTIEVLRKLVRNFDLVNIEDIINVLYMTLYIVGGTN